MFVRASGLFRCKSGCQITEYIREREATCNFQNRQKIVPRRRVLKGEGSWRHLPFEVRTCILRQTGIPVVAYHTTQVEAMELVIRQNRVINR